MDQRQQPGATVLLLGLCGGQGAAIGGLVLDGHSQGERAAELANAILRARRPAPSPPRRIRGEYLFSKSELARWHLTAPDAWQDKVSYVE
jgi:hypothetical protein